MKEALLQRNDKDALKKLGWIYNLKKKSMSEIDIQITINDQTDICVRINKKDSSQYDNNGVRIERHLIEERTQDNHMDSAEIFYFESGLYEDIENSAQSMSTNSKIAVK